MSEAPDPFDADDLPGRIEPPPGLAEFEEFVFSATAPSVVTMPRSTLRKLLRYLRRMESAT